MPKSSFAESKDCVFIDVIAIFAKIGSILAKIGSIVAKIGSKFANTQRKHAVCGEFPDCARAGRKQINVHKLLCRPVCNRCLLDDARRCHWDELR